MKTTVMDHTHVFRCLQMEQRSHKQQGLQWLCLVTDNWLFFTVFHELFPMLTALEWIEQVRCNTVIRICYFSLTQERKIIMLMWVSAHSEKMRGKTCWQEKQSKKELLKLSKSEGSATITTHLSSYNIQQVFVIFVLRMSCR